jgi:mannose-6-phosphate isomerase-like protein (cupin superfamily)
MARNIIYSFLILSALYLLVGGLISNYLFPPKHPDYAQYFSEHPTLTSNVEGFKIKVKKVENGHAFVRLELSPTAVGPPEHIHETFDEFFMVEKGTLSLLINGEKIILHEGESKIIPKGTPHRLFNESNDVVVINDSLNSKASMTAAFVYGLAQLYPQMDKIGNANSPKMLLHLAAQGNGFDTWVSNAPIPVQKMIRWLLSPSAKLLGF